jgi:predicted heme/steroid binding protein
MTDKKKDKKVDPGAPKVFDNYIVDGKVYDLTDWIPKHPGGEIWFARSNGRDISAAIHAYHKNPAGCKKILEKYESDMTFDEAVDPTLNVPAFILPKNFDARKDGLSFNWKNENSFL